MTKPMLFVNLLSLIAPTLWVVAAGALGFSVGAYGPRLFNRIKNDCLTRSSNPANAKALPRRNASRRAANPRKSAARTTSRRNGRKRPAA